MALAPAIRTIEALQERPALARLLAWKPAAVEAAVLDREELTLILERSGLREACAILEADPATRFDFLSDLTCVDRYPGEPRFEVVYHLLSLPRKERVRLKVRVPGDDPNLESVTSVWPAANYFEREVFDLFGVRFAGHPYLRRLLMPEDWQGHPLRKDYPVEGYR
ncbi:MAG TPA: NADH-quinone oxidoreductase subunit C [Terriglobales bacterium]|nr:NADH-quinone oxidoreductase subunit C [Terriglobales bacterium]